MPSRRWAVVVVLLLTTPGTTPAQARGDFVPVTDEMLQGPAPADWLMWRRTLNGWGFSPLDQHGAGLAGHRHAAGPRGRPEDPAGRVRGWPGSACSKKGGGRCPSVTPVS